MKTNQSKIEKLISELCPNGVGFLELGSVCNIKTGQSVNKIMIEKNKGEYPVINSGKDPLGYINIYNTENDPIGITSRGAGVGSITWCEGKYFRGNLNYSVTVIDKNILNVRYLYFILMNSQKQINELSVFNGIPALNASSLIKLKIPIPPLAIQEEIVKILNSFIELEVELEVELEARKKQYNYYHKDLFDLRENFELKTLGDLYEFQYGEGNTIPTSGGKFPVYGSNGIVGSHDKFNSEDAPVIGHIGAYAGIVNWAQGKHFVTYNGVICKIKPGVNPRFGYHLLILQDFRSKANAGSQPFVSYDMLRNTEVKIPPISIQNKIADVLDKFDALVNDISIGLPAELKARRSQYEYYRGKLLTFNEYVK